MEPFFWAFTFSSSALRLAISASLPAITVFASSSNRSYGASRDATSVWISLRSSSCEEGLGRTSGGVGRNG